MGVSVNGQTRLCKTAVTGLGASPDSGMSEYELFANLLFC